MDTASPIAIPPRVRRAALTIVDFGGNPGELLNELGAIEGFTTVSDVMEVIRERLGGAEAEAFPRRLARTHQGMNIVLKGEISRVADSVLEALPDVLFIQALNIALEPHSFLPPDARRDYRLSTLFARNAVPYEFESKSYSVVPAGDSLLAATTLEPGVDALASELAFATAHQLLLKAISTFREGVGASAPADALDDARMAIEAGLLAFIDQSPRASRPSKHTPDPLFQALQDAGHIGPEPKELILGVARLRGRTAAGHAGRPAVDRDDAEAAIGSAAASLLFLVRRYCRLRDSGW